MPICKQRKHCKHCFISVDPVVPPVGLKDQPSLRSADPVGALPLSKTKLNFFSDLRQQAVGKRLQHSGAGQFFIDWKSELLAYNTSPRPSSYHHDHHQVNAMKDSQVSRILTTVNTSIKDFDSSKCPAVK